MASFYDTVNDTELEWVEALLQKGGIEYALREIGGNPILMKEIQVAEEDLAAADSILCSNLAH
ncbi:MAG: hypothetical protein A2X79_00775 [Desulfuromonadaceae bacterium GWB2_53_15]|nr:MAG: hypothetical protein A2X79_00775 [Desulfuromonadaceae bacterium GWB2_53_15]